MHRIRYFYHQQFRYFIFRFLFGLIPRHIFCWTHYVFRFWRIPFFRKQRSFNERIIAYKLSQIGVQLPYTVDKLCAKDFIAQKVGVRYVVPTLRVFDEVDTMNFSGLPAKFVLKASHGCGMNLMVDQERLTLSEAQSAARLWVKRNHYWYRREWPYKLIEPRIYAEHRLGSDAVPEDFKFFVFKGVVRLIEVDLSRFSGHRRALVTPDWQLIRVEYQVRSASSLPVAPLQLSEMITLAEKIGKEFDFVRVDLYAVDGIIYIGELTHFPQAGMGRFSPPEFDDELGSMWTENRPIGSEWIVDTESSA